MCPSAESLWEIKYKENGGMVCKTLNTLPNKFKYFKKLYYYFKQILEWCFIFKKIVNGFAQD